MPDVRQMRMEKEPEAKTLLAISRELRANSAEVVERAKRTVERAERLRQTNSKNNNREKQAAK